MSLNEELVQTVSNLIDAGCHYRVDELAEAYAPDLQTIMVQPQNKMIRFDYEQNMEFFRSRREAGEKPIKTDVEFLVADVHGDLGFVIGTRTMEPGGGRFKSVFNLMLRKNEAGKWQVFREQAVITRK
ncbi:hypothetical protein [Corynebacterium sp.]|uniref:hypothetical protein n=1 Tax=Corynebacterium sp. TaxID=1720 RepID=UPI0026DB08FA|nr:hypothetical protein [Corynebacterium sp.]MDO5076448.1 hypothetical protein [Corynebacterium sp.]